jgi:alkanesulfonate monooxygenase SsuD/methylene tetrahydromethanopterin reductase-like flavin-dependent oxidoreductase (luciferase family)
VKLAEELGYESVYVTHINGRESLTVITAYAAATSRIRVGTGVVPIYTRTPATMAQTAATIQDLSGGRCVLGLGVSHRPVVEAWHGQSIDKPLAETREYTGTVRSILAGEPVGETSKWPTSFALAGIGPFPDLPIYLAGLSPGMLRLAGEIADGVILWLCNPEYIRQVVVPAVAEGREKAGKPLEGFDIVPAVPAALVEDPTDAYATMQRDLIPYFGLPFYRKMLSLSGFDADIAAFDAAVATGDPAALAAAISTDFIDGLCALGDEAAVRAGVQRYRDAGATSPAVSGIPKTGFEEMLRAAAGA